MIYLPKKFQNENEALTLKIIENYPLATLISVDSSSPFISHIPLILDNQSNKMTLIGHMAKANPHWKLLNDKPIQIIFHGPNEYISPKWYLENDVPTWNYAVIHIEGQCHLIEDLNGILECLKLLSHASELKSKDPWDFWLPEDLSGPGIIEKSIVGIKIEVHSLKAKFKLNQNRSESDLNGVIKGLESKNTDSGREVAALMKTTWNEFRVDTRQK